MKDNYNSFNEFKDFVLLFISCSSYPGGIMLVCTRTEENKSINKILLITDDCGQSIKPHMT